MLVSGESLNIKVIIFIYRFLVLNIKIGQNKKNVELITKSRIK